MCVSVQYRPESWNGSRNSGNGGFALNCTKTALQIKCSAPVIIDAGVTTCRRWFDTISSEYAGHLFCTGSISRCAQCLVAIDPTGGAARIGNCGFATNGTIFTDRTFQSHFCVMECCDIGRAGNRRCRRPGWHWPHRHHRNLTHNPIALCWPWQVEESEKGNA